MVKSNIKENQFLKDFPKFSLVEEVKYPNGGYSEFYSDSSTAIIIDYDICNSVDNQIFSYNLITNKQNKYINDYTKVYRFLGYQKKEVEKCLSGENESLIYKPTIDRSNYADASPLEYKFEENFSNVYGIKALSKLIKEYAIADEKGNQYYLDYLINTDKQIYAIEENGITYHHPQIIKEDRYIKQLNKQNTCSKQNIKLFRFSSEDCKFENRIEDDIRAYLGNDASLFKDDGILVNRSFKLYDHQQLTLQEMNDKRKAGIDAFLVVLPTASGKSKIIEEDIKEFSKNKKDFKALILVPTIPVLNDWENRAKNTLTDIDVDIFTYAYACKELLHYSEDYYDYIVVDEAHHAVAPTIKRVIQHFNPDFLVGLTATDERLDNKKLEDVFGSYKTNLSLEEAMQKGIIAKAHVYRIETNINLSNIRFNGKDYVNADLEKSIRVTSRNELIVDVINQYFNDDLTKNKQGVIFCVNTVHAKEMAKLLNSSGIPAMDYTSSTKNREKIMLDFKEHKIRFLCSCNMISEGWDYPELEILVMARPTLSKVLYLQQIGRGLRKTSTKKNVFVIDVVDEYGSIIKPYSMHAIFHNSLYVPFGDITRQDYKPDDMIVVSGLNETIDKITEIDIGTFEDKYSDYLSVEQLAREYFVSTGTITSWIKKNKIEPSFKYKFGSKYIYLFSPEDVLKYKKELDIKEHNDNTIKNDFFDFLEERDYSLSYKMPFLLALMDSLNDIGDASIDDVLNKYISFYQNRIDQGLIVDKKSCPYNVETLKDKDFIKRNMLTNPFEKFERKRFIYYSKDLGIISFNHALFNQLTDKDKDRIIKQMHEDIDAYYSKL